MKKQASDKRNTSKGNSRTLKVLIIISAVLLLAGACFLAVEPIKSLRRQKITDDAMEIMVSKMSEAAATTSPEEDENDIEVTYVVPRDGNEAAGEEYDYFGENEEDNKALKDFIAARKAKLPKNVTLSCIGVLEINKINKRLPVWNSTSSVALRYGVGLYEGSVRPGKDGNAAILGHNMKNTTLFSKLYKLSVGDNVRFIKLNGQFQDFRIDKIEIVYRTKLGKYVDGDASDTPQLTLITCANDTGYGNRRVIICHPVN